MFVEKGFSRVPFDSVADCYIINTCSVTNTADAKSRKMIRKAIKMNPDAFVGVMGCYSQAKPDEVSKIIGVNAVIGNNHKKEMVELVLNNKVDECYVDVKDILRDTTYEDLMSFEFEHTRAFLKIEDGCDNFCSYCIIPYTRGRVRSKPYKDVLKEIQGIVYKGYKEVVLSGIHTGKYRDNDVNLSALVKMIVNEVKGLRRLRLSSIEINEIDDEFLEMLQNEKVIAKHLHLPLQAGSDEILKLMNRKYDTNYFYEKVQKIRNACKDISITTDVIVGFPTETDEQFNESLEFIKKVRFSGIHVFPYSKREKTKAALMTQVKDQVKDNRAKELMNLSKELEAEYAQKFVGKTLDIIVENTHEEYLVGHTTNYLKVLIPKMTDFIGKDIQVKIEKYEYPYCYGKVVEE